MIRDFDIADIEKLLNIYNYYVENTTATFDVEALELNTFRQKIDEISKEYPVLVYEENEDVLGFAYASKFRPKPAYNYTLEATVYVKHDQHGKQIGSKLYEKLIQRIKATKTHSLLGVLTLPNTSSERLHEKFGFQKVGHIPDAGFKFGKWHDIGIYLLKLY